MRGFPSRRSSNPSTRFAARSTRVRCTGYSRAGAGAWYSPSRSSSTDSRGSSGTVARRCSSTWRSAQVLHLRLVLWPQDVVYLAVLLILSACRLFSSPPSRAPVVRLAARNGLTEILPWIERSIEGDRVARMKLDQRRGARASSDSRRPSRRVDRALALDRLTFVGYFTPSGPGARGRYAFLRRWEWFWILSLWLATYGNAGWIREKVCKHMCPYARFQSAMFDSDTLVITYDARRRAARQPRPQSRPKAGGAGRVRGLQYLRAVCPGNRHPRQACVRGIAARPASTAATG